MKKYIKNGFTLVELLAVLVILAIIVLLAINRIKNSVKKSSEQALIANAQVFVKAVNDDNEIMMITNAGITAPIPIYSPIEILPDSLAALGISSTLSSARYIMSPVIIPAPSPAPDILFL